MGDKASPVGGDTIHLDLFSGIGGFALAVDSVWPEATHIFCEIDKYCQEVLKLRWKGSKIYGDIRTLTAEGFASDAKSAGQLRKKQYENNNKSQQGGSPINVNEVYQEPRPFILTGGFPCQPFSQAGKRKGTDDNRHLWPEMLRVISDFKPTWVIAENVRGLLTIEGGMVFEQVCLDLEGEGYEVQPIIIPACAVNAPHRRDRVWFVAHSRHGDGQRGFESREREEKVGGGDNGQPQQPVENGGVGIISKDTDASEQSLNDPHRDEHRGGREQIRETESVSGKCGEALHTRLPSGTVEDAPNRLSERLEGSIEQREGLSGQQNRNGSNQRRAWEQNWLEVATELCGVDDGLPAELDGLKLSKSRHRVERLKALGNAIVPQVAIEIMKAIKEAK